MRVLCDGQACGCGNGEFVELTEKEQEADEVLYALLAAGISLKEAVDRCSWGKERFAHGFGRVSPAFWQWKLGKSIVELRESNWLG